MKKPSSLAQQVEQAQRTFNGWTAAQKSSVRLEGSTGTLARFSSSEVLSLQAKGHSSKKQAA